MPNGQPVAPGSPLWELLPRLFEAHGLGPSFYSVVSKSAGLDDETVVRVVKEKKLRLTHGKLMKIAAALELRPAERTELEGSVGMARGSLRQTEARLLPKEKAISMRRAVLLLTAPADPHLLPLHPTRKLVATRTGVVFGWHDVVVRITTPEQLSVLDYADDLFKTGRLRTIETIPLRDDLPMYVDQEFDAKPVRADDYFWAVIFVQALGTPGHPEPVEIFHDTASEYLGGIHVLTAAVAVGRFDSVVEVLAGSLLQLQLYVRRAQELCQENGQQVHTVTYFASEWRQRPYVAEF
jgi:hypothetical protein